MDNRSIISGVASLSESLGSPFDLAAVEEFAKALALVYVDEERRLGELSQRLGTPEITDPPGTAWPLVFREVARLINSDKTGLKKGQAA